MRRRCLAKACYVLLVASIPASLLPVMWLTQGMRKWLEREAPAVLGFLSAHLLPAIPSWIQYTAIQTLAAALLVCAAAWLLLRTGRLPRPAFGKRSVFPLLVVAYAVWAALTCLWSVWPYASRAYLIRELPFYVLAVAAYYLCGRRERWVPIAWALLISAALAGALQGGVVHAMARANDISLDVSFKRYAIVYSNRNFGGPGLVAALLLTAGLGARLVVRTVTDPPRRLAGRVVRGATFALMAAAAGAAGYVLLLADALATKVALVVALAAYVICVLPLKRRWPIVLPLVLAGGIAALTVLANDALWMRAQRLAWSPTTTAHVRMVDGIISYQLYSRRPLHGWGMGTFPATYAQFQPTVAHTLRFTRDVRVTHPHCEPARVLTDQGLIGLLLYVALIGYAFVVAYRRLRSEPPPFRFVAWALWAAALGFIVQGALGKAAMNWGFSASMWILLGVLASTARRQNNEADDEDGPVSAVPPWRWAALAAVAGATCWGWWEWAAGGYASNVHVNQARYLQQTEMKPRSDAAQAALRHFIIARDAARRRCLWPDEMLHMDYVEGWFRTAIDQSSEAIAVLEKVQELAPEFMDTRLHLAVCYRRLGREAEAREQLAEFMRRDPYELMAYTVAYRQDRADGTRMLAEHIYGRLQRPDNWVIEDYPTFEEVRRLLTYYAASSRWRDAQMLVASVQEFFATADVRTQFDPLNAVRSLVKRYRARDLDETVESLLLAFPEARRPRAQSETTQGG